MQSLSSALSTFLIKYGPHWTYNPGGLDCHWLPRSDVLQMLLPGASLSCCREQVMQFVAICLPPAQNQTWFKTKKPQPVKPLKSTQRSPRMNPWSALGWATAEYAQFKLLPALTSNYPGVHKDARSFVRCFAPCCVPISLQIELASFGRQHARTCKRKRNHDLRGVRRQLFENLGCDLHEKYQKIISPSSLKELIFPNFGLPSFC